MNKITSIILVTVLSFIVIGCEKKPETSAAGSAETTAAQANSAPASSSEADKLYTQANAHRDKGEHDKAFEAFSKAAELGSVCAPFFIGIAYENGEGRQADTKQAIEWYTKASAKGCAEAGNRLKLLTSKK